MGIMNVALNIPDYIVQGIANQTFERVGGVIRMAGSKQIVAWLREANEIGNPVLANIPILPEIGAVSSTLNLAVSTMGFILVLKRLDGINKQLEQAQQALQSINYKIDLTFYGNFRAAIDQAFNAFTMTSSENRKISAMQAVNRLLEAEHHYGKLADREIGNGSQVAGEYLSTLCLAYVTESRCYLELEEIETARRRLQVGVAELRPRFEKYTHTLLTSHPAAYLHPSLKGKIGLKHLTKVYQWLQPGLDECDVFEMQRENLFDLARKPEKWLAALPQALRIPKDDSLLGRAKEITKKSPELEVYGRLPAWMELMETMVEDDNRLAMYEAEVEMIGRLEMSFQEWRQLTPPAAAQENRTDLMCITVS